MKSNVPQDGVQKLITDESIIETPSLSTIASSESPQDTTCWRAGNYRFLNKRVADLDGRIISGSRT